jgi:hypothetical protein
MHCVFIGYSNLHKGYKCVYISRDIIFDESIFPFAELCAKARFAIMLRFFFYLHHHHPRVHQILIWLMIQIIPAYFLPMCGLITLCSHRESKL